MLNAGYLFSVIPMLQLGGQIIAGYDTAGETLGFRLLAVFNIPLSSGRLDSVWIGGGFGYNDITRPGQRLFIRGDAGIRVRIVDHLYWRPMASFISNNGANGVIIEPVALSLRL